jgi:phospholipase/carboxylesterase
VNPSLSADEDDVRRRALELADFVEDAAPLRHRAPIALGYSNGANIQRP